MKKCQIPKSKCPMNDKYTMSKLGYIVIGDRCLIRETHFNLKATFWVGAFWI
jgi:hypothetical protein